MCETLKASGLAAWMAKVRGNESAIYFGTPDCDFDATFGEICPASIRMAQEPPGDAPTQLAP